MAVAVACPDVQVLQQLLLGRMPPDEVERLAKHCEQCPKCIAVLHTLKADDTLVEALAAQKTNPDQPLEPGTSALIERLQRVRPLGPPRELDVTVGDGDTPSASGPAEASTDATHEGFAFLSPSQGPGEMGRLGGYRVLSLLGAGGMGMVLKAEDPRLHRPIALKVMKSEVASNPLARERFLREAQAAAGLHSDHVVTIYQVGEERDVVFLAMEYLEGMSLEDWLKKGRTPTVAQAARIGRQIALGLADAHARGLIHRDVKPANVWLDSRQQGRAKLLDFGLARAAVGADDHQLTQSGAIVGTPSYMAPEQARGEGVDHRADLFSLGVVLYRLCTGQLPFRGDNTMSVLMALAVEQPRPPREVNPALPPRLAALIERLLCKDREQRPATAKMVADELALIEREASQPTAVPAVQTQPTGAPLRSRLRKYIVAASLLFFLGGVAAAVVIIIRDKQGNKIAEIKTAPGVTIEIQDDKDKGKEAPPEKKEPPSPSSALTPLRPGEPLSLAALVRQPAKLPGVRSWSIEKRDSWMTTTLAYRPDGKRLAVGDSDGTIRIWEPDSGRLVQMAVETHPVGLLAWSPDGKWLAVGTSETAGQSAIQLWDAPAGRSRWRMETPRGGNLAALAWSADGRALLASVTNVGCLTLNPADGKLLRRIAIPCNLAAFTPDAKRLAGTGENRLVLWDVETGKEIRKLDEFKYAALPSLAWSPDGKRLALTAADGVSVWQAETGERIGHYKDLSQSHFVCWSPNGRTFAVSLPHPRGTAVVDVGAEGQPLRLEDGGMASLAWSPDGKTLARIAWGGGGGGGWVRLYDPATGKRRRSLTEGCGINFSVALSSDGGTVALAEGSERALSSTDTGQVIWRLKDTSGVFALSPDGKRLAVGGPEHAVILWEDGGKTRIPLMGHQVDVSYLAWSPDGKRLASSSDGEKRVLLWDAEKAEKLRELGPFPASAQSLTWSPDGQFVAFLVPEVGWHFWNVEQNKLANNPKQWLGDSLVFAPDGRSALLRSSFHDVYRLRDLATGKEGAELPYIRSQPPAWSPDGRLLAVATDLGVELWRGDLSRRVRRLQATCHPVNQIAFSPDGKLTVGVAGQRVHLWETDTGRLHGVLLLGEQSNGLTIAADGRYSGNDQVERGLVVVVQKDDGTQELLEPADFEQKYGFKNEPDKVHLCQPLPPPLYPLSGMPMGPPALVREPAELPGAISWTIETVNARGEVRAVAYRPDGGRGGVAPPLLATGGDDGVIRLWDTASGKLVRMLVGPAVESLAWSKDGKVLSAAGPGGRDGREWDADTGRLLRRVSGIAIPAAKTARSPDGTQTATADGEGIHVNDAQGKLQHTLQRPNDCIPAALAWSPDSCCLLLRFKDGRNNQVVEVATGQPRPALAADGWRTAVRSPDGRLQVSLKGSAIYLQDAAGLPLGVLLPFDTFGQLTVTADGRYRGNVRIERAIRMVVQKRDGTTETLTPRDFEDRYGFKNEPAKVRLFRRVSPTNAGEEK
jgi:WD40 repeat protein